MTDEIIPVRGAFLIQSGTNLQNLQQGIKQGGMPAENGLEKNGKPVLLMGAYEPSSSDPTMHQLIAVSVKPLASGQNALVVTTGAGFTGSLTASSPAAAAVGVASGSVLTANPERKGLILINTSANQISIAFGAAAVLASGITLNALGGSFTMDASCYTTQEVFAIAGAAGSNLAIQEFV